MNRQPDPLQPDAFEQRFSCHHTRAEERILSRVTHQASPNGVLEHIANDGQQVVALTKHAIMPTWLPQVIAGVLTVHIARILLRKSCKLRDIAVSVDGLNDQMHMIWHEAVRGYCNMRLDACAQKLPQGAFSVGCRDKCRPAPAGAESQQSSHRASVVFGFEPRPTLPHGAVACKRQARWRAGLKPALQSASAQTFCHRPIWQG